MRMRKLTRVALILASTLSLTSCSWYPSEKNLDGLSLFISKDEAIEKMNSKGIARGAIVNKFGQSIEIREYKTIDWLGRSLPDVEQTYWLYFCDGKLVQWGRAGDWTQAQKMIYDINFNMTTQG